MIVVGIQCLSLDSLTESDSLNLYYFQIHWDLFVGTSSEIFSKTVDKVNINSKFLRHRFPCQSLLFLGTLSLGIIFKGRGQDIF